MKLFVGLGNPGREYASTKHNVGFMLADALSARLNAPAWKNDSTFRAELTATYIDGLKVMLVKPQTFMNLSGEAVRPIADYYRIDVEDLIVAHDDMDLPLGTVRLRPKGSSGGHRGVQSIIDHFGGRQDFARIRIGVGRPPEGWAVNNHVLSAFADDDREKISEAVKYLEAAAISIMVDGIDAAMNKFNPKKNAHSPAPFS